MMVNRVVYSLAACACAAVTLLAQPATNILFLPPDVADATFDVVSIKESHSTDPRTLMAGAVRGIYRATNATAIHLILAAYPLQASRVLGMPSWAASRRYDVVATIPAGSPRRDRQMAMVRHALAERFKLRAHAELREMPVYALVSMRGIPAPIKRAAIDCAAVALGRGGSAVAPAFEPGQRPPCGMIMTPGTLSARGQSLESFATTISPYLGRPVVDRTGLTGSYDFDLAWMPDPVGGAPAVDAPASDPNSTSLFTALQEQLQLKLESTRAPVEVLVVDSIEPPAEN